ncbi:MAG TPA: hypothetical protein VJ010_03330, partial [Actinomycetota bacterium]|nr:hypothetical protein [Actinomycetota bacterium]
DVLNPQRVIECMAHPGLGTKAPLKAPGQVPEAPLKAAGQIKTGGFGTGDGRSPGGRTPEPPE